MEWQDRRESNPQPSVLETDALPIELLSSKAPKTQPSMLLDFTFFVKGVFTTKRTKLAQSHFFWLVLLVFVRRIVATLTLLATETD